MTLAALCCLVAALVQAGRELRRGRAILSLPAAHQSKRLRRIRGFYDRSRPGRRVAERLWRAQVHMSPSAWRCAQVLVAVPIATLLTPLGVDVLPALASASTAAPGRSRRRRLAGARLGFDRHPAQRSDAVEVSLRGRLASARPRHSGACACARHRARRMGERCSGDPGRGIALQTRRSRADGIARTAGCRGARPARW